jgi:hypothetical protein
MIMAFSGFNGSGKTISLVRELLTYKVVFCNFNYKGRPDQKIFRGIDTDELFRMLREYIESIGGIKYIKENHITIALAIDEGGLLYSSSFWKKMTRIEAYLFAQHRKLGIDFYYSTQNMGMINRTLRYNTACICFCWHFFFFGVQKWFVGFQKKKENKLYESYYFLPAYYKYYDTNEIIEATRFFIDGPR